MRKALCPGSNNHCYAIHKDFAKVVDETHKLESENNAIKRNTSILERAAYDRNGKLLVALTKQAYHGWS
jgi:hypothetical protein